MPWFALRWHGVNHPLSIQYHTVYIQSWAFQPSYKVPWSSKITSFTCGPAEIFINGFV